MKRTTAIRAAVAVAAGVALAAVTLPATAQQRPDGLAASPADPAPATAERVATTADALVNGAAQAATLRRSPGDALVRTGVHQGTRGLRYVSYERTYRGLPVVGGDVVVATDAAGTVRGTAVAQQRAISVGTTPKVTAAAAAATSRPVMPKLEQASSPRLVVLAWGNPRLAYETVLTGTAERGRPSKVHVFVDAATGKVTESYDEILEGTGNGFYYGQVSINTSGSGNSFSMVDPTRPGIQCGGQNGAAFTGTDDVWGNGQGTNLETACVDVLYGVQKEWDMLGSWLGRNGINGSGRGFPARVGLNQVNAFWNGSFTSFGHNQANDRQATSIDVVAHEFGHAIFQTTPGGSSGGRETGGLNEGAADIFGALTEHFANNPNDPPDYEVGEEVDLVGQGPIRFMYNPSLADDPNCFSSAIPGTEVHAAAGPLNHWFYLTAEGSNPGGGKPNSPTCDNSTVTGLGIRKAGEIFYNAMLLKTSGWRYVNVRVASLTAAKNLFPGSCAEFNVVKAAWNAVSVPAQPNEPTCGTAPPPPPPPPPGCTATNGTDVAIPDAPAAAVTSAATISGCGRAPSATSTVAVNIVHTYRGDLVIDLVAPDGTAYRLKNSNRSDSADNVNQTFTVNLGSETANGEWRLRVQDVLRDDTGRIDTWTLTL